MIDTLIVGAGPSGLCAAKTLLEYDPSANVVLVDARTTPGGVWSREQLYPTLKTNNLWGTLDFTDFPMEQARFGVRPGQHVTGEAMHAYLAAYAEHFGLTRRIRFRTRVLSVCRGQEDRAGWCVSVKHGDSEAKEVISCRRLIVATGVTNVPHVPAIRGIDDFNAPHLHSADLGRSADALFNNPAVQTVAVLGGSKSAYDAVYLAASTGHKVEWIIRRSGRGPVWVFPTHTFIGPIKAFRERLITRRFFSFMSPCIWPDYSGFGWLRRFLHGSKLGRAVAQTFWGAIHADTIRDCGYKTNAKLGVLEPEQSPFWYGTSSGTLNYDQDIFSFVKSGLVQIHREDLSYLSDHTVHLASGTELPVDALIISTGFSAKPAVSFQPTTMHADLGVPSTEYTDAQKSQWAERDDRADLTIAAQFPRLIQGPFTGPASSDKKPYNPGMAAEVAYTPWRLYRGIAPPGLTEQGDRSLVFLGMFSNVANTIRLEIQCLWALAYLEGKLPSLDGEGARGRVMEETALFQRYTRHRAPYGHGPFYPDLVFDQVPYWDILLHDLGLPTRRKASAFKELFEPYSQGDYRGLVKQWVAKNSK